MRRRCACRTARGCRLFGYAPAFGQDAAEQASPRNVDIASHVAEAAQRFGFPEGWIYAVMRTESAGRIVRSRQRAQWA
jgi:soluble lytic murein transglycosylase-like protein